jgi:hydroxyacylglutathione hydrolase
VLFRQILHEDLGCASYLIADRGRAAIVDPKWEIEDYLGLAEGQELRIEHVLETHNHADHLSGHGRLVEATAATMHVSAEAGVEYEHEALRDGDVLELGRVRIRALSTPGHRPEHIAFVVEDIARASAPWLVLTGDSLFVGDVARPDLAVVPEEGARGLYGSLRRVLELGDHVEVWPGHIGGSLCGGPSMSKKPSSTLGFERRFSPLLQLEGEAGFVRGLTAEMPPQPPSFERVVELNRGPLVTRERVVEPLAPAAVGPGAIVLDGRDPREFDGEHVPGSINVTMSKTAVGTRASWVAELDDEIVLVGASDPDAARFAVLLEAVGFRNLRGYLAGGIAAWKAAGRRIESTPAIDVETLARQLRAGEALLLDVREQDEWEAGHVEGSIHVPYHELRDGVPEGVELDGRPIAVACTVGNRSSIAASLLQRAGVEGVEHVAEGGVADLDRYGIELTTG